MNLFLSKYYLLEKATLPELISAQTIEALAQRDIPGIFMAMKPIDVTLTEEQVQAIKDFRAVFAQNYNYTSEWMTQWQQDFDNNHGSLKGILAGLGWATLVPTGVYVVAHGELLVWRVRAGEPPMVFKNHDAVEPTKTGDTWLITWEKEIAKPDVQIPAQVVALDYAEKLYEDKTDKERFDILSIENQFDLSKPHAIPSQNQALGRRVLAIAKRLEAAGQPFSVFKPYLSALTQHATVGKEAASLLAKYNIKAQPPVVQPPAEIPVVPVVKPEKPIVKPEKPIFKPEKPVVKPETPIIVPEIAVEAAEIEAGNDKPFDYRPILWGIAISGAVIFGYQYYYERQKPAVVSPGWPKSKGAIKNLPTIPIDSLVRNPPLPKTEVSNLDIPAPPIDPNVKPIPTKPLPPLKPYQRDYDRANKLLKAAETNIEKCADCIEEAILSVEKANAAGLDAASVLVMSGKVRDVRQKVLDKLQNESKALIKEGEETGGDGLSVKASDILKRAKAKLELESKLKPSEEVKTRLKTVNERIAHWDSIFGAGPR
ncbi:MAG: hypothetical protein RL329_118 [Bacteroidota bacterium]